jgi:hypothetical protein
MSSNWCSFAQISFPCYPTQWLDTSECVSFELGSSKLKTRYLLLFPRTCARCYNQPIIF